MQVIISTICTPVLDGYNDNYFYSLPLIILRMFTEVVIETTATVVLNSVFHDQLTTYIHITL